MKKLILLVVVLASFFSCKQKTYDEIQVITPEEMKELMLIEGTQLIDIRTPKELEDGYIKGAQNIDYMSDTFDTDIEKLDKSKPVLLYCRTGRRSGNCSEKMVKKGFVEIYDLQGGITQWKKQGFEIVK